jgi:hypothetical protein
MGRVLVKSGDCGPVRAAKQLGRVRGWQPKSKDKGQTIGFQLISISVFQSGKGELDLLVVAG